MYVFLEIKRQLCSYFGTIFFIFREKNIYIAMNFLKFLCVNNFKQRKTGYNLLATCEVSLVSSK